MKLPSNAPLYQKSGLATGLDHRILYVARISNNGAGQNGNSWVATSLPYLHYSTTTVSGMPAKVILMGAGGGQWDWVSETGYVALFGAQRRLVVDGSNLRMFNPDGSAVTFFGPSITGALRGRQSGAVSAFGIVTTIAYDPISLRLASETRTDPATGD